LSKTYRRKNQKVKLRQLNGSSAIWYYFANCCFYRPPTKSELSKAKAVYYSDSGTNDFKEPGPSWFRNLYHERPLRRKNKLELKKFMLNPEYEPMVCAKGKLPYWT
jgi:hypothetical protein